MQAIAHSHCGIVDSEKLDTELSAGDYRRAKHTSVSTLPFKSQGHVPHGLNKKTFAGVPVHGSQHPRHGLPFSVIEICETFQQVVAVDAVRPVFFRDEFQALAQGK